MPLNRRELLSLLPAAGLASLAPFDVLAQESMPTRPIPATGEALPVIGLGSSKGVGEISAAGTEQLARVLQTLVAHGGRVVDTWPRDAENDAGFGRIINTPDLREALFVTSKIDRVGEEAGLAQFRETLELYQREQVDLLQIFDLTDVYTHWPTLRRMKDEGKARYIGVTTAQNRLHDEMLTFLGREQPDFIQVNYSLSERGAEERILPMAADRGIAVLINRPFMNGSYFDILEGVPLPQWTQEFGCESWAQFSLKYNLANENLTCVLTETTNPEHMAENARASYGEMPSPATLARMREFIDAL